MATHVKLQERGGLGGRGEDEMCFSERVNEDEAPSEVSKMMRKRGHGRLRRAPSVCSSIRGSSVPRSGLRLRRASQLAGRRRGPSTPVPSWKLVGDMESAEAQLHHHHHHMHDHHQAERPSATVVSARRLAATLWELQPVPFSKGGVTRSRDAHRHQSNMIPSTTKASEAIPFSPASSRRRERFAKPLTAQNKMEPTRSMIPQVNPATDVKSLWKDLAQGPATSNEFLKVLSHVRSLEEQHKSSTSLVDSLRRELDESRAQLRALMQNERDHRIEVEGIAKKLTEERAMWQEQQEESVGLALQSVKEELYHERRAKSRLESLQRRLSKEFQELKKALGKALHDLERERKARELMEDVCDELAREIGEDKARVEEMKRESAKVREEVEEERKMLQMAEIWREERVQMKLMEAKLELEEKNTALDKLRGELEAFLKAKRAANTGNHTPVSVMQEELNRPASKDGVIGRNLADPFHAREARVPARHSIDSRRSSVSRPKQRLQGLEEDEDSSVGEDDLHSIAISHHDAHPKSELMQRSRSSQYDHHKEVDDRERRSVDDHPEHDRQVHGSRYQGLHRSRSSQMRHGSQHRNDYLASETQGVNWGEGSGGERVAMKEWNEDLQASSLNDGQEETINTWPSENEGSRGGGGRSSFSPPRRPTRRKTEIYEEAVNLESSGTNAAWLRQIVESSRDFPATSGFAPMHQQMYVKSSPTRHWNHFWSSPDLVGSPHQQGKSKGGGGGSGEMSGGLRDNSLKAKLLEAKLEGQQARLRAGMG